MKFSDVLTLGLATLAIASPTGRWKPHKSNLQTNYTNSVENLSGPYPNTTNTSSNLNANYTNSTTVGNLRDNQTAPANNALNMNTTVGGAIDQNTEVIRNIESLLQMIVADVDRLASAAGADSSRIFSRMGISLVKKEDTEENEKRDLLSVNSAAGNLIVDVLGQLARLGATAGVSLLGSLSSGLV